MSTLTDREKAEGMLQGFLNLTGHRVVVNRTDGAALTAAGVSSDLFDVVEYLMEDEQ